MHILLFFVPRVVSANIDALPLLTLAHPCSHSSDSTPTPIPSRHQISRKLHQIFSDEEVRHVFLPIPGIVRTWVLGTGGPGGVVTDMCGFYHLHSSIMGHPQHKTLCAVYSYYNVAKTMSLQALYADLLVMAYNSGADVFNALDVMDNESVFEDLKFGQGDGFLHYYVYNWRCPQLEPGQVGMVLV